MRNVIEIKRLTFDNYSKVMDDIIEFIEGQGYDIKTTGNYGNHATLARLQMSDYITSREFDSLGPHFTLQRCSYNKAPDWVIYFVQYTLNAGKPTYRMNAYFTFIVETEDDALSIQIKLKFAC
jgi:hypothetical protein